MFRLHLTLILAATFAAEPALAQEAEVAEAELTKPTAPEEQSDERPLKVLILGDSMAATDFGKDLERRLDRNPRIDCARRGKSATGLARPDYFDWIKEAKRQLKKHKPELVVVIIGGNDGQDLIARRRNRRRVIWGSGRWRAQYKARLRSFLQVLMSDPERKVAWLELPVMDRRGLERKLKTIRATQREVLRSLGSRAVYINTRDFFMTKKGRLIRRVKVKGYRRPQKLRQRDGIHFTVPGSRYFASKVYPRMLEALGLSEGAAQRL